MATSFLLSGHERGYALTWQEACWMPLRSPYAQRHSELAQKCSPAQAKSALAHRVICAVESIPIVSVVVSLIERVVAAVSERWNSSKPAPITFEDLPHDVLPIILTHVPIQQLGQVSTVSKKFNEALSVISDQLKRKVLQELHFEERDIRFLCKEGQHFGLRHLMGEKRALKEEKEGINTSDPDVGRSRESALNLNPMNGNDSFRLLFNMDHHPFLELDDAQIPTLQKKMEEGVDQFLREAFTWVISRTSSGILLGSTKSIDYVKTVENSCFSLIRLNNSLACDFRNWGNGLGRRCFGEILPSQVIRLGFLKVEHLFYQPEDLERVITNEAEYEAITARMVALARTHLIRALRKEAALEEEPSTSDCTA